MFVVLWGYTGYRGYKMLNVLISGKLQKAPRTGVGKNGQSWTAATVRISVKGADGSADSVFASCIAFGDEAGKLAALSAGDAVSIAGSAKLSTWQGTDGTVKPTLDIQASGVMSAYQVQKKRGADVHQGQNTAHRGHRTDDRYPFNDAATF